jgi:hypothetical protein
MKKGKTFSLVMATFALAFLFIAGNQAWSVVPTNWYRVNYNGFISGYGPSNGVYLFVFEKNMYAYNDDGVFLLKDPIVKDWAQLNLPDPPSGPGDTPDLFMAFGDYLYAYNNAKLWWIQKGKDLASSNWNAVTSIGLPSGESPYPKVMFNNHIYGIYWNTSSNTFEIWRTGNIGTTTATWQRVVMNSFGDTTNNQWVDIMIEYNNRIYAGVNTLKGTFGDARDYGTGVEIWESTTGNAGSWSQVNVDGFGVIFQGCINPGTQFEVCDFPIHQVLGSAAVYKPPGATQEYLYIGTKTHYGAEIWRYDGTGTSGWQNVTPSWAGPGWGSSAGRNEAMVVFQGNLYLAEGFPTANLARYNGTSWTIVAAGPNPFESDNIRLESLAVHNNRLYVTARANTMGIRGDQVWGYPFISPEDILGSWPSGSFFRNGLNGYWGRITTNANLVAAGDINTMDYDDFIGAWNSGLWIKYTETGDWVKLSSTMPSDISSGDMDGDGRVNVLATWAGSGVWYWHYMEKLWVKMSSAASKIAAGDVDGDGKDDLIGVFSSGLWVKFSSRGLWGKLALSIPTDIAAGDMNGDGRDDVVGTWATGVWYWNPKTGVWVKMSDPLTLQVSAGNIDGDSTDDLLGVWNNGLWVKYSSSLSWKLISKPLPEDIDAGLFRGGGRIGTTYFKSPISGTYAEGPESSHYLDLSDRGPGGRNISYIVEDNLVPVETASSIARRKPGPEESGFMYIEQKNLVPQELKNKEEKKPN